MSPQPCCCICPRWAGPATIPRPKRARLPDGAHPARGHRLVLSRKGVMLGGFCQEGFMIERLFLVSALMLAAAPATAADQPTPADAKAMLAKAVTFYKDHGRKAAFDAFNKNQPPFS